MKNKFTLDGANYDFWKQIIYNKKNKINTWAIFWYATIFQNNGICLNPVISYTRNIGNDGTGENCDNNDIYFTDINMNFYNNFPILNEINMIFYDLIRKFYLENKISIKNRIKNKLIKYFRNK